MIIRREQIDNFLLYDEDTLVKAIMRIIRQRIPLMVFGYSDELFEDMVRTGIKRARSNRFRSASDLTVFVTFMFEIAPNFDEHTKIKRLFDDPKIPVDKRFDHVLNSTSDEDWKEAKEAYDSEVWFPETDEDSNG